MIYGSDFVPSLLEEDQKYLLPIYHRLAIIIKKARNVYLYDEKGNRYLDMFSGIAVNSLGHNNKKIKRAIKKQLNRYLHLSNYFVSKEAVCLAKILVTESGLSKVFFANSGTEANEAALKLARVYGKGINFEKTEVITLIDSFHGRTLGSLSLTGQVAKKQLYEPLLSGIIHVNRNDIKELQQAVSDKTCAIFLELIQGESGVHPLTQDYLDEVIRLAKEYQFLIVVDEVQTGLMRTGKLFTFQHFNLNPDIITLAKSLGGGLPLGGVIVSERLTSVLNYGEHGTTFGGNPLACRVGASLVTALVNTKFQEDLQDKSSWLFDNLEALKTKFPTIIKDVRGRGMMIGVDVGCYAEKIQTAAFNKKILLNITNNSVIRLLPPLIITKKQLQFFLDSFQLILEEIEVNNETRK